MIPTTLCFYSFSGCLGGSTRSLDTTWCPSLFQLQAGHHHNAVQNHYGVHKGTLNRVDWQTVECRRGRVYGLISSSNPAMENISLQFEIGRISAGTLTAIEHYFPFTILEPLISLLALGHIGGLCYGGRIQGNVPCGIS